MFRIPLDPMIRGAGTAGRFSGASAWATDWVGAWGVADQGISDDIQEAMVIPN
jgi:hypothetical protein